MTHALLNRAVFITFFLTAAAALSALPANAQTRTWVSGTGNDADPCSRTAPCKTFAGAISKTAAGGEINVLDSGGFGAVTITKSISISGIGVESGVLVSGTNAIVISAGANDQISLIGLDVEGLGTGLDGVKVISGGRVHVHNCSFRHFSSAGVHVIPNAGQTSYVLVTDSSFDENSFGVAISSVNGGGAVATAFLDRVTIMGKGPVSGSTGVAVDGSQGSIVLNASTIVRNQTGLSETNGGQMFSFGNNRVVQNGTNGAPNNPNLAFE